MASFFDDLQGSLATALSGSTNPYVSFAGGLLGDGGGSGPVIKRTPPPPPPPTQAPGGFLGALSPGMGIGVGAAIIGTALVLAVLLRRGKRRR